MKRNLLVAAVLASMPLVAAETEKKQFDAKNITGIEVRNGAGAIKIVSGGDTTTEVVAEKKKFGPSCTLTMEQKGKTLVIEAKQKGVSYGDCEVAFDVKAPKNVDVKVKSGSGDLSVEKVKGEIDFEVGSGSVSIASEVTELDGKSGSGTVKVSGLVGDADVKVGSGNISLSYAKELKEADVSVRNGSGNTEVLLPATATVSTSFKSGSGKLYNEIGETEKAGVKVSVRSGSGDLTVKRN